MHEAFCGCPTPVSRSSAAIGLVGCGRDDGQRSETVTVDELKKAKAALAADSAFRTLFQETEWIAATATRDTAPGSRAPAHQRPVPGGVRRDGYPA